MTALVYPQTQISAALHCSTSTTITGGAKRQTAEHVSPKWHSANNMKVPARIWDVPGNDMCHAMKKEKDIVINTT
jgi:hypothetical protein